LDSTGVGWFSLFVAAAALAYSFASFRLLADRPFGVIWLYWSFLWFLFFLLFGLKLDGLTAYTGWVTTIEGIVTAAVPGFLILAGYWEDWNATAIAITLAVIGIVMALGLWPLSHPRAHARAPTPARPSAPPRHP
jgi:putative amide transporter protein